MTESKESSDRLSDAPRMENNDNAELPDGAYLRMTFFTDGDVRYEYAPGRVRTDIIGMKLCVGNVTLALWQILDWINRQIRAQQFDRAMAEKSLLEALTNIPANATEN